MININEGKKTYFLSGMFLIAAVLMVVILFLSILRHAPGFSVEETQNVFYSFAYAVICGAAGWIIYTRTKWYEIWYLKKTIYEENNRGLTMHVLIHELKQSKETWISDKMDTLRNDVNFSTENFKANVLKILENNRLKFDNFEKYMLEIFKNADLVKYSKSYSEKELEFDRLQEQLIDELVDLEKEKSDQSIKEIRLKKIAEFLFEEYYQQKNSYLEGINKDVASLQT